MWPTLLILWILPQIPLSSGLAFPKPTPAIMPPRSHHACVPHFSTTAFSHTIGLLPTYLPMGLVRPEDHIYVHSSFLAFHINNLALIYKFFVLLKYRKIHKKGHHLPIIPNLCLISERIYKLDKQAWVILKYKKTSIKIVVHIMRSRGKSRKMKLGKP